MGSGQGRSITTSLGLTCQIWDTFGPNLARYPPRVIKTHEPSVCTSNMGQHKCHTRFAGPSEQ
eukprot:8783772-Pyramimonas_sp.AAC.1